MVYRRTQRDINSVSKYAHLLQDHDSNNSKQPVSAKNQWRSENTNYLVFKAYAPNRDCGVTLHEPLTVITWDPPELEALQELPYFTEQCEGRVWDTSGRLYRRDNYPLEQNLIIPKHRWTGKESVLIHAI